MNEEKHRPEPFVPAEIDLRSNRWMPLDVVRLLGSETLRQGKKQPDALRASLILWSKSWHEVPAGSIPADDETLAHWVEMTPKKWSAMRDQILRGFVLCADGRLYHAVICEKVMEAWAFKVKQSGRAKARYTGQLELGDNRGDKLGTHPSTDPAVAGAVGLPTRGLPKNVLSFVLPDWVPVEAWNGYVEMRKLKKHPLTDRAKEHEVRDLLALKLAGEDPGAVLLQSERKGWLGLYAVKNRGHVPPGAQSAGGRPAGSESAIAAFVSKGEKNA